MNYEMEREKFYELFDELCSVESIPEPEPVAFFSDEILVNQCSIKEPERI